MLSCFSSLQLVVTLWIVPHQAPLSMGILLPSILELVAMPSSRGSFQPRDQTHVSYIFCTGRWVLYQLHLGSPNIVIACTLCPWDSPGKNTRVGCHFLLQGSSWPRDRMSCFSPALADGIFTTSSRTPRIKSCPQLSPQIMEKAGSWASLPLRSWGLASVHK